MAGYLVLALILTWPTISRLSTHLPGDGGDDPAIAWNLWWIKYALLNAGGQPFHTDFMFFPVGINLAFYTLTVLNALTALPVTLTFGVVAASNLHLLFSFVAGGYGAFLLVRYILTPSRPKIPAGEHLVWMSAALAGGFYAFAGSKLFYVALGQFNIAGTHWIPFALLYVIRTRHNPRRLKNPLMAGLFITLQTWAEMTYATFIVVFAALYWAYWLVAGWLSTRKQGAWRTSILPHIVAALVMGITVLAGISPILANMLPDMLTEGDILVEGSGFAGAFSADLLGFFIPTMHHPLLENLIGATGITAFNKGQHIYLGFSLLGLALIAATTGYRHPQIRFWLVAGLAFALLTLGPVITVNGQATSIPGPFVIFQQLPFFKGNRYPSRYSVMLILSLSVLAGFGLLWLGNWLRKQNRQKLVATVMALIAALFLFEHLSAPLPQSDMRIPAPYQTIAADPGDFAVLDIPFAWRNGFRITGALTTQFMFGQFYQTLHQKKMLQGNTSRNPEFKFQYFAQAPIINSLLALQTGKTLPPEQWQTDRKIAAETLRFFDIRYIVVRPDDTGNAIVTPQATLPYIEKIFPVEKIYDDASLKIYRVTNAPTEPNLQISADNPLAPLYFGEGWGAIIPGQPIAAQRKSARLMLPLTGEAQRITVEMRPLQEAAVAGQTLSLQVGNWQSPPHVVKSKENLYQFHIPAKAVQPGLNDVWLNFSDTAQLPAFLNGPLRDITVISAGEEVGGLGHIYINGRDVSPNGRGYNIAIIEQGESPVLKTAAFDTHLNPAASAALADFIEAPPESAIIAIAAADEAAAALSEAAVQAIRQATGASGDLRGCFRCSHAIIGPGTPVQEAIDPLRPVSVSTGLGLTEPNVAALINRIQVEAMSNE